MRKRNLLVEVCELHLLVGDPRLVVALVLCLHRDVLVVGGLENLAHAAEVHSHEDLNVTPAQELI